MTDDRLLFRPLSMDIKKAFLHITLKERDRNFTHFLWLSDSLDPTSEFLVYCFRRVLFGAVSSPFMLFATLHHHLQLHDTPLSRNIQANLYVVDNVVSGIAIFWKSLCLTVPWEILTARLRELSFKAMLHQEMGWHDLELNSTRILTTEPGQDASQVQGATGTRLGMVVEGLMGMVLAVIIVLVYSWLLTIVLLGLVPILMLAGFLQLKAPTGHAKKIKKAPTQQDQERLWTTLQLRNVHDALQPREQETD